MRIIIKSTRKGGAREQIEEQKPRQGGTCDGIDGLKERKMADYLPIVDSPDCHGILWSDGGGEGNFDWSVRTHERGSCSNRRQ
jgi:hypothetical protein